MSTTHASPPDLIDCHTAVRRLWDFLDQELDATRFAEVEQHIASCAKCAEHVEFAKSIIRAIKSNATDEPGEAPALSLRQRVISQLASEGYSRA